MCSHKILWLLPFERIYRSARTVLTKRCHPKTKSANFMSTSLLCLPKKKTSKYLHTNCECHVGSQINNCWGPGLRSIVRWPVRVIPIAHCKLWSLNFSLRNFPPSYFSLQISHFEISHFSLRISHFEISHFSLQNVSWSLAYLIRNLAIYRHSSWEKNCGFTPNLDFNPVFTKFNSTEFLYACLHQRVCIKGKEN